MHVDLDLTQGADDMASKRQTQQRQQMQGMGPTGAAAAPIIEVQLCVPGSEARFLPTRRLAPDFLPPQAPLPRVDDIVYLSRRSSWKVWLLIHRWLAPDRLRIEVWIEHVSLPSKLVQGFEVTQ